MSVDLESLRRQMVCKRTGTLWIFGYGSLIWKPGFTFYRRIVGYLEGYSRRFYQGTTTHRGTAEWPGRVATILSDPSSLCWGVAYQVEGPEAIDQAILHLAEREMITGGYHFEQVTFHSVEGRTFPIQVYVADAVNTQYLGDAPLPVQAYQILRAHGVCGPNREYVDRVVDFMVDEVPGGLAEDPHLQELDSCMRRLRSGEMRLTPTQWRQLPVHVAEARGDEEFKRQVQQRRRLQSLSESVDGRASQDVSSEEDEDMKEDRRSQEIYGLVLLQHLHDPRLQAFRSRTDDVTESQFLTALNRPALVCAATRD